MSRAGSLARQIKSLYGSGDLHTACEASEKLIQAELTAIMCETYAECIKETASAVRLALSHIKNNFEKAGGDF